MVLEVNIHDVQTIILRELLFHEDLTFSKLQQKSGITSDHFNFHLSKLVEIGMIKKVARGKYSLSSKGKEYANKLDTDNNTIERQPKVSVILVVERQTDNGIQYLFQQRLKQPYYGYIGLISGKMRWGETVIAAAERELMEETGLVADCKIVGMYHEIASEQNCLDIREDKIFFVVSCINSVDELIELFEGGRNEWMYDKDVYKMKNTFKNLKLKIGFTQSKNKFVESEELYPEGSF